jgi:hypothetical protein
LGAGGGVEGIGCERGSWAVPLLGGPGPFRLFPSAMKKSRPIRRRFFLECQGLAPVYINQKSTKARSAVLKTLLLICCEGKILFRLKKQVKKDGL